MVTFNPGKDLLEQNKPELVVSVVIIGALWDHRRLWVTGILGYINANSLEGP